MAKAQRLFIVRVFWDEHGLLHGQISDPHSEWRVPFRTAADLWRLLSTDPGAIGPPEQPAKREHHEGSR